MDLMERTNDKRRTFIKDRLEHKLDDAVREKVRLEQANELLKEELDRESREREQMLSALEKGMRPQKSKLRRVMLLGVGVGAAYVYGAKAGRARYDEIVSWWDRTRGRASEFQTDAQRAVSEKADRFSGQAQTAADGIADKVERAATSTSDTIETSGRKAANTVRSTTKDATTRDTR
jgi:hypothetical protein